MTLLSHPAVNIGNQGLGKLRDSSDLLPRALVYLRQRQPTEDPAIAEVG